MSNPATLAVAPRGVWSSGRALVTTTFNAATQTVGVIGSGISALSQYATAFEHTAMIDCAVTVYTHRDTAIHAAAVTMVANLEAIHVAKNLKGTFDRNKAYAACEAKLEAKIPA